MPLDKEYYDKFVNFLDKTIKEVFCEEIENISKEYHIQYLGAFKVIYKYLPSNFTIIVENEIRTFDIIILDHEGAKNNLYRIVKFDNQLCKENIIHAIQILKVVLEKGNFDLFFERNNKLYRKNSEGIKRVKDIKELYNG